MIGVTIFEFKDLYIPIICCKC